MSELGILYTTLEEDAPISSALETNSWTLEFNIPLHWIKALQGFPAPGFLRVVVPVQSTQECARGHHPAEDMGVKGESGITVHNGIRIIQRTQRITASGFVNDIHSIPWRMLIFTTSKATPMLH